MWYIIRIEKPHTNINIMINKLSAGSEPNKKRKREKKGKQKREKQT